MAAELLLIILLDADTRDDRNLAVVGVAGQFLGVDEELLPVTLVSSVAVDIDTRFGATDVKSVDEHRVLKLVTG